MLPKSALLQNLALLVAMATFASPMKVIKEVLSRPRRHWVGNAFHVFPVFASKAFTEELSPFLMFD